MTAGKNATFGAAGAAPRLFALLLALLLAAAPVVARAADRLILKAETGQGYGRLILDFADRLDLPAYTVKSDNGVLAVEFKSPVEVKLPDVSGTLQDFVSVARVDPDSKGLRFGLKAQVDIHTMEAGEQIYIDLLPSGWQGLPPSLPAGVVDALAKRAKDAELNAEQRRMAELAKTDPPKIEVRAGRHPTFYRLQFDWSADTKAKYAQNGTSGRIDFSWPVSIDLFSALASLPDAVTAITDTVDATGSHVNLMLKDGIEPRFYAESPRRFVLDIDLPEQDAGSVDLASLMKSVTVPSKEMAGQPAPVGDSAAEAAKRAPSEQTAITPKIESVGKTIRITFPFEVDTPAAVFRRGDTLWLLFDTPVAIEPPHKNADFDMVANGFSATRSGDTQVVKIPLAVDRLATLGSEGRSWVLSLGDTLLAPTEPLSLKPRLKPDGKYEVFADLAKPYKVHQMRDPDVGDVLDVVTAYPPAHGAVKRLDYVDFSALRSVHGLVIKPNHDDVRVDIDGNLAVIGDTDGLTVSLPGDARSADAGDAAHRRAGYIDLVSFIEPNPADLTARIEQTMQRAAVSEGRLRDSARLELARIYLANQLGQEALGVVSLLKEQVSQHDFDQQIAMTEAAADVIAHRPDDALRILNAENMSGQVDASFWRTLARTATRDYAGARVDALAAEPVAGSYPDWLKSRFYLAATRAALEVSDTALATRMLDAIDFKRLDAEQASLYRLFNGRVDEEEGHPDEALDAYGQVITADIRPTRAEAVYRTLLVLDKMGKLDTAKAARALSQQTMVWRGDALEAQMQTFLAELYFRNKDYRDAFDTVKSAAEAHGTSEPVQKLVDEARKQFVDLYLNGKADQMQPVDALSLYYDFRELTPAGARGDEMIRDLARRLVKVDLLGQAADLLRYQIDNRLEGAARAQIAADLAVIEIANHRPDQALKALNDTRLSDLPPSLERQRRVLEARALIDAGRDDLALDMLGDLKGRDADLLRVDANWQAQHYRQAGEILERLYAPKDPSDLLSQTARMNIVKAAVAYVLAGDRIGLSRVQAKFSEQMSKAPEWPVFQFVTGQIRVNSAEFRKLTQQVAGMDSLNAFLASYGEMYAADGALAPGPQKTTKAG
ncbi:MAG TPA: hypothetical protein VIL84_14130 [Devosiaceae bacterium]